MFLISLVWYTFIAKNLNKIIWLFRKLIFNPFKNRNYLKWYDQPENFRFYNFDFRKICKLPDISEMQGM